jgi:hypothetical protein
MSNRARTAAFTAAIALGVWLLASTVSKSADDKGSKTGPYNDDIVKLADGLGKATDIASKADLEDVMQAFKPRSKGGLGIGPKPDAIKPDGIEQKFLAVGNSKKALDRAEMAKSGAALAKAADATKAIGEITLLYADKAGKKNPTKWKQYATDMTKSADELAKAIRKGDDGALIKKAMMKVNDSCTNCHGDFRD